MEGNCVSSSEQLAYLGRLAQLVDLNLRCNPVSRQDGYASKVREVCPGLQVLDDNAPSCEDSFREEQRLVTTPRPLSLISKRFISLCGF